MDILRKAVLAAAVACVLAPGARAQISPGPLARPHEALEGMKNCLKCHKLGAGPDAKKCLDCHREVEYLIEQKRGFHYRKVTLENAPCFECHGDHAGKDFELVYWKDGREQFDHDETGYELLGAHLKAKCRDCHRPDFVKTDLRAMQEEISMSRTFLGLSAECLACHSNEHRDQLVEDCRTCHGDVHWKPAPGFNHDTANFKLTGLHIKARCEACHPVIGEGQGAYTRYKGIDFAGCVSCHNDPHQGRFVASCESCHDTGGWRSFAQGNFDHSTTGYPLLGRHRAVACEGCHVAGSKFGKVAHEACTNCHTDVHRGQFAEYAGCEQCHSVDGFKPSRYSLDDHAKSRFPLDGAHRARECVACHGMTEVDAHGTYQRFTFADIACATCHADVHRNQFTGGCERCHDSNRFTPARYTLADHAKSGFPLEGAHAAQPCVVCHKERSADDGAGYRQFAGTPAQCSACHTDVHAGQFRQGPKAKGCSECHGVEQWSALDFDHDRDTSYRLEGAHLKVKCAGCHLGVSEGGQSFVRYRPIDPSCKTCHTQEGIESRGL